MKNVFHNTIAVQHGTRSDQYCLYWQNEDGNDSEYICVVYGFDNAMRVANGIAYKQAEFVKAPVPQFSSWIAQQEGL